MRQSMLEYLVCPATGAALTWVKAKGELWCRASRLAYPIRDGIPIMMVESARVLSEDECLKGGR